MLDHSGSILAEPRKIVGLAFLEAQESFASLPQGLDSFLRDGSCSPAFEIALLCLSKPKCNTKIRVDTQSREAGLRVPNAMPAAMHHWCQN